MWEVSGEGVWGGKWEGVQEHVCMYMEKVNGEVCGGVSGEGGIYREHGEEG